MQQHDGNVALDPARTLRDLDERSLSLAVLQVHIAATLQQQHRTFIAEGGGEGEEMGYKGRNEVSLNAI